jgi:hypothetical protein
MYEGKAPAAWRGRRLSPAIRQPMRVPRENSCEVGGSSRLRRVGVPVLPLLSRVL